MPVSKLLVLDYDQTMVENTFDLYEAYCEALRQYNSNCISYGDFIEILRGNRLDKAIPIDVDLVEFFREFRRHYKSRHSYPQKGLRELLIILKILDFKVIVVSGRETSSQYIIWDLRRHGLDEYVDDVLTIHDLHLINGKEEFLFDKSGLIEYAMRKHGVIGVAICIGDYVTDFYSCKKINGVFIGLNSIPERNEYLRDIGAEFLAGDFSEVFYLLSELGLFNL